MLSKALEEMFTWLRGLYLVMLFLPALLTAPLCISLGYKRASWVKVSLLIICIITFTSSGHETVERLLTQAAKL